MKNWENKYTIKHFLFIMALLLYIFSVVLELTIIGETGIISRPASIFRYLAYGFSLISIIDDRMSEKMMWILVLSGGILLVSMVKSGNKTLFLTFLMIIGAYRFPSEKLIRITKNVAMLILIVTVAASQAGLIEDFIFTSDDRIRHGLGFAWTSTGAILYTFFLLQWIYLKREKVYLWQVLLFEGINYAFYYFTDSRMAFAASSAFLLFYYVAAKTSFLEKITFRLKKIVLCFPVVLSFLTIYVQNSFQEGSAVWKKWDSFLSGRLHLGNAAIRNYGLNLFGNKIKWIGYSTTKAVKTKDYNYVDCSYLQIGLTFGLAVLVLILALYTVLLYRAYQNNDCYLVWILCFILIFSMTEPRLVSLAFNPFPLLLFSDLLKGKKSCGLYQRKSRNKWEYDKTEIN